MIGAGEQIGGYTIMHLLGRGGMGEVYLAQHRRVARRAAIKFLIPELSQNAVVLERFFNEARAASLIRHPGIVEILDCDLHQGQAYIVMEYLDGESFGGYLFRTGALEQDLPFLLGVSMAVASAVGAAHTTGIIHRDLKPDNIHLHLGQSGGSVTVKILDFGIAKLALQDGAPSQTNTGVLLGTPTYMSPEQCRGAGRVDSRSDIYSLGCILYEAACGFPPFVREGMGDLIIAHVAEAPVPPMEHVRSLPPVLNDLILRMLAKGADERPQTMEDVVTALRACATSLGIATDGPLRPRVPVERPAESIETAATQPPQVSGPSGVETARLGPRSRPLQAEEAVPLAAPRSSSARSAGVSASRRVSSRTSLSGPTSSEYNPSAPKSTTLSSTAAEMAAIREPPRRNGRWIAVAAGLVVAIGVGVAALRSRPAAVEPSAASLNHDVPVKPVVAAPTPPAVPAPDPTPAPRAAAPDNQAATPRADAPPPVPAPDTVRIDFQGLPAGTTALVDGVRTSLPATLPRGSQTHRFVLRPPGESSRAIDLDGSRDRIVDFVATTKSTSGGREHDGAHHTGSGSKSGRKDKGSSGSTDRDAITDI